MKTTPSCPRCVAPLMADNVRDHGVVHNAWSCPKCRGFWISREQLGELETQEQARIIEFRSLPSTEEQQRPLNCPECGKGMEKVTSSRDPHVTIDVCTRCQKAWLDDGEMKAIRTESFVSMVSQLFQYLRKRK